MKIATDHHRLCRNAVDENCPNEVGCAELSELIGERDDHHEVNTESAQCLYFLRGRENLLGDAGRIDQTQGVAVERHNDNAPTVGAGVKFVDDRSVPSVNSVELAHRDDGGNTVRGNRPAHELALFRSHQSPTIGRTSGM